MTNKDLNEEEKKYREILGKNPNDVNALVNLGIVLNEQEQYQEAVTFFQKALKFVPEDEQVLHELSFALAIQDKLEEAEEIYRKILKINPKKTSILFNLALVLYKKQNLTEAEEIYLQLVEMQPDDSSTWLNLGVVQYDLNKLDEAEQAYRKALELKPKYTKAVLNLVNVLEEKGEINEAADVVLKAFKENRYCTILLREYYRLTKTGFYIPNIVDAYPEKYYDYKDKSTNEDYIAIVLDIIQSIGDIRYKYILYFYKDKVDIPIYYVSLEKNNLFEELGGPSHFLCAFEEEQNHVNYGGFEEEITIENFAKRALEVVAQKYKLEAKEFKEA